MIALAVLVRSTLAPYNSDRQQYGVRMPNYKNRFRAPAYLEETIEDENGTVLGTIRVKPSSVLWKPKNAHKYYSVSLASFAEWIMDPDTKARQTKS